MESVCPFAHSRELASYPYRETHKSDTESPTLIFEDTFQYYPRMYSYTPYFFTTRWNKVIPRVRKSPKWSPSQFEMLK
jgi:hypothetical protein